MANQYKNLSNFKAYKARIFEYLSAEIIKLPEFFKYQSLLTGQASSTQTMAQGGIAQQTIRNGQVVKNRNIAETILSFDNAASQHKEDDDIITRIAVALQNNEPNNINLNVGLYIWPGYGELAGPYFSTNKELYISEAKQLVEGMIGQIAYLPFIRILNSTDILLSPDSIQPMYDTLAVSNTSEENFPTYSVFKSLIETKGFDLTEGYNIADNTSQFLPVGAKKRNISKKILRDTSETAINELLPTTSEYKIDQFFKSWQKIQSIVPLGKEYIVGGTYINNGDFSGGVGPGILTHIWDTIPNEDLLTLLENEESNVVNYPDIGSDSGQQQIWDAYNNFMDTTFASFPNSPWRFGNRAIAAASQQIEEFENPGFSPFVLSSRRNAPTRFFVKAENLAYTPGLDYTLSAYVTQDDEFNQLQDPTLKPENIFFYRIVAYEPNTPGQVAEIIKDYPAKDVNSINILENGTEFRTGIKGENVSNWFGETSEWTRYKHTFNYNGSNSSGELIDMSQYQNGLRVRIEWNLAYQNSVMNVFDASDLGITEFADFFTGPRLNQNNNQSKQYYTGIRINVGDVITGLNRIELSTPEPKTITSLLKNCIDLTLNESGEIPLYSSGQLNALIRAQDSSTRIFSLLNEIRNGLITTISNLTDQFGEVIPALVQSFTQDASQNPPVETDAAREASEAINQALSGSNLPNAITTLTNNFDQIYTQIRTNDAALLEGTLDSVSHAPNIQQLNGYDDDGFLFSEPLTARYNEYHEKWEDTGLNGDIWYHGEDANDSRSHLKAEFNHQWVIGDGQYVASKYLTNGSDWDAFGFQSNVSLGSYPNDHRNGGLHEKYTSFHSFLASYGDTSNSPILPNIFEPINAQTPIAAMYHSEVTPYNENVNLRGGIFGNQPVDGYSTNYDNSTGYEDSYFNNYFDYNDCYPGYTYGPYAAKNSPRSDFGLNPIQRMIGIMDAYVSKMAQQTTITGIDVIQQFQGMEDGDNGVINSNFIPLREYVYMTGRGREWMYMVYPKIAHQKNTPFTYYELINSNYANGVLYGDGTDLIEYLTGHDQGFGMTTLHNQGGGDPNLVPMQNQSVNGFPLGYNKSNQLTGVSGDYYHGTLDYTGNNGDVQSSVPPDHIQYHRFYEPHWEWNPIMNKFIFRFAQPVIGSTAHRGMAKTHPSHPLNGYGGQYGNENLNDPTSYMGERKYKFATMKLFS